MRFFAVILMPLLLALEVTAQTPVTKPPPPASSRPAAVKPDGTLAQVMRGILFPSSNLLFDAQQVDPGAPKKAEPGRGGGASASYASVYSGWEMVEGASAALEEAADIILKPGRLCSNGKPAPVGRADYIRFAQELRAAGRKALAAAKTKSQEKVSDVTNDVADACSNCHEVYRDKGPFGSPARCTP